MEIKFYILFQFGFLISFGEAYGKRKYICFDLPFLTIQFIQKK